MHRNLTKHGLGLNEDTHTDRSPICGLPDKFAGQPSSTTTLSRPLARQKTQEALAKMSSNADVLHTRATTPCTPAGECESPRHSSIEMRDTCMVDLGQQRSQLCFGIEELASDIQAAFHHNFRPLHEPVTLQSRQHWICDRA